MWSGDVSSSQSEREAKAESPEEVESDILSTSIIDARFKGIHYFPDLQVSGDLEKSRKHRATKHRGKNKTGQVLVAGGYSFLHGQQKNQRKFKQDSAQGYQGRAGGPSALENLAAEESRRMERLLRDTSKSMSATYSREYQIAKDTAAKKKKLEESRKRELMQAGRVFLERQNHAATLKHQNLEKQVLAEERIEKLLRAEGLQRLELYEAEALRYVKQCAKQQIQAQDKLSDTSLYRKAQHEVAMRKLHEDERRRRFLIEQRVMAEQNKLEEFTARRERYRQMYAQQKYDLERAKLGLSIPGEANAAFLEEQRLLQQEKEAQQSLAEQEHRHRIEQQQKLRILEKQRNMEQNQMRQNYLHQQMCQMRNVQQDRFVHPYDFVQQQQQQQQRDQHERTQHHPQSEFDCPPVGSQAMSGNWATAPSPASTATCSRVPSRVMLSRENLTADSDNTFIFSSTPPSTNYPEIPREEQTLHRNMHGGAMQVSRSAGFIEQPRFSTPPFVLSESPQPSCDSTSLPPPERSRHSFDTSQDAPPKHHLFTNQMPNTQFPQNEKQQFQQFQQQQGNVSQYPHPGPSDIARAQNHPQQPHHQHYQQQYYHPQPQQPQQPQPQQQFSPRSPFNPGQEYQQQQHRSTTYPSDTNWFYIDTQGQVQGPFDHQRMRTWNQRGLFPADLLVQAGNCLPDGFEPLHRVFPNLQDAFAEEIVS